MMMVIYITVCTFNIIKKLYPFNSVILVALIMPAVCYLLVNANHQLSYIISSNRFTFVDTILKYRAINKLMAINKNQEEERNTHIMFKGFLFAHITHCREPDCPIIEYFYKGKSLSAILSDTQTRVRLINNLVLVQYSKTIGVCSKDERLHLTLLIGQSMIQNCHNALIFVKKLIEIRNEVGRIKRYLIYKSM